MASGDGAVIAHRLSHFVGGCKMKRRTLGFAVGIVYGLTITWGAFYQALAGDGLMILATVVLGLGAGVISGGLLFALIAMCPSDTERAAAAPQNPETFRAAA